ncbi:MAG: helix-turn-helix domain-containing protein [Cyclobacteriaceae bacterium]
MTEDINMEMSRFAETTLQFINSTSGHIFLTGKAGTGKTTFLKNLEKHTHKQFAIVAPTGIAALNAGGVTIHSQFLFPLGTFLPDRSIPSDFNVDEGFFTQNTLARKHPLNSVRKQVLRSIDLLVIDEVSMLRADVLDAIDYRLRAARGNFKRSFGGVQLLLIGDLYQLPPVVRRNEESMLQRYYPSAWFYESLALKQDGFVYIELDKIFRQQDDLFINILNNLRNNTPTESDIAELNSHYKNEDEIRKVKEVITLTTHNYKADEMNKTALQELPSNSHYFEAQIEGEFPESMFPVQERLELKEGAQIMFIRNDSENQMYFNGKLATVSRIQGNTVEVLLAESHTSFELRRERWENKKYTINKSTNDLDDEVVGSFSQYPVKLAWAITVHKSQGLTFEKAIIDVGQAFTGGQVYVALSRLRSISGLILRSRIHSGVISADNQIVSFSKNNNKPAELPEVMRQKQSEFISFLIDKTFDFSGLVKEMGYITKSKKETISLKEVSMQPVLEQISISLEGERENTEKFRWQLQNLLRADDQEKLLERIKKGSDYYKKILEENVKKLLTHTAEMKQHKRVKTYLNGLEELDQLFSKTLEEVDKSQLLIEGILKGNQSFDFSILAKVRLAERGRLFDEIKAQFPDSKKGSGKKKGGRKKDGPSTYDITLQMWKEGKDIETIAKERELVPGTIEGHLAKAVQSGQIEIFDFIKEEDVKLISKAIEELPKEFTSKDLFGKLDGKYSYAKLRAVMSYVELK